MELWEAKKSERNQMETRVRKLSRIDTMVLSWAPNYVLFIQYKYAHIVL